MERKCHKCSTWNTDNDFCTNCGEAISPKEVLKKEQVQKDLKAQLIPKGKVDVLLNKFKNSKNPFVKVLYVVCFSLWTIYMAIMTFFLWFVALGPG